MKPLDPKESGASAISQSQPNTTCAAPSSQRPEKVGDSIRLSRSVARPPHREPNRLDSTAILSTGTPKPMPVHGDPRRKKGQPPSGSKTISRNEANLHDPAFMSLHINTVRDTPRRQVEPGLPCPLRCRGRSRRRPLRVPHRAQPDQPTQGWSQDAPDNSAKRTQFPQQATRKLKPYQQLGTALHASSTLKLSRARQQAVRDETPRPEGKWWKRNLAKPTQYNLCRTKLAKT